MRFSYEKCKKKVDNILSPKESKIPPIYDKQNILVSINKAITEFKLPILYRYMSFNEYAEQGIKNEDIYMVSGAEVNDAFEGIVISESSTQLDTEIYNEHSQSEIYIKSFSCKKNNLLMWSHYADAHKGICIGYDFARVSEEIKHHLYPVQYSNVIPSIDDINRLRIHEFMYLRKSCCWSYEKEWRLIYKKEDLPYINHNITLNCISEIQFGLRTSEEIKRKIFEIVKEKNEKGSSIKLYETIKSEEGYSLKTVPYIAEKSISSLNIESGKEDASFDVEEWEKILLGQSKN